MMHTGLAKSVVLNLVIVDKMGFSIQNTQQPSALSTTNTCETKLVTYKATLGDIACQHSVQLTMLALISLVGPLLAYFEHVDCFSPFSTLSRPHKEQREAELGH